MENVPTPAADPRQKPRVVRIAHTLWVCTGVMLLLIGLSACASNQATTLTEEALTLDIIAAFYLLLGVLVLVFAARFGRGGPGARNAITVVGCVGLLGCWTIPLVVAALILQSRPEAVAWFAAMHPPRG